MSAEFLLSLLGLALRGARDDGTSGSRSRKGGETCSPQSQDRSTAARLLPSWDGMEQSFVALMIVAEEYARGTYAGSPNEELTTSTKEERCEA